MREIVGVGASFPKTGTLLRVSRATISKVMKVYVENTIEENQLP
jgi:hypothetical protein